MGALGSDTDGRGVARYDALIERLTAAPEVRARRRYEQLRQKHRFSRPQSELRVAVNDYFAKWTDEIYEGDSVVFITPVAGG